MIPAEIDLTVFFNSNLPMPWHVSNIEYKQPFSYNFLKFEPNKPGEKEICSSFNDLISCEMGECKNVRLGVSTSICLFESMVVNIH